MPVPLYVEGFPKSPASSDANGSRRARYFTVNAKTPDDAEGILAVHEGIRSGAQYVDQGGDIPDPDLVALLF